MANTPFLDLVKPAGTDHALVSVINSNSDKIDGGVSTLSEQIAYTTITSGSLNSYTGDNGHTLYYKGSDISQFTDIPSATSGNAWPFVLEVIKMGSYAKQILHVFTSPTKMDNPPTYIRQQTYQSGSIVWGGWFSAVDQYGTCENLGNFTTQSALETALNNVISGMDTSTNKAIQIACTGAFSVFQSGVTYNAMITKGGASNNYASVLFQSISGTAAPIIKATKSQSWRFEQLVTKSDISSTSGGVPIRKAGSISNNGSFQVELSSDFSANEGFALVALNLSGNGYAGAALLFLGRGTEKKKDILGNMSTSSYSATYSNGVWTITNTSGSSMYYTVILSK